MSKKENLDPVQTFSIPASEETVSVVHNGVTYENQTKESLASLVPSEAVNQLWADGLEKKAGIATRNKIRDSITRKVGDTQAILGTTADVTQLNAAAILALIAAFGSGDTYSKFRTEFMNTIEALVPEKDGADVYAQAGAFLAAVQSGDVILTAALKGLPTVINEMATRSTGVAHVLIAAQEDAKD